MARAGGAEVATIALEPGAAAWALDLDRLRAAVGPHTRLVAVNAPNNPPGWLPSAADFAEIVRIADEAGATLLSDEVYRLLEHDPADRLPPAATLSERAVSLGVIVLPPSAPSLGQMNECTPIE